MRRGSERVFDDSLAGTIDVQRVMDTLRRERIPLPSTELGRIFISARPIIDQATSTLPASRILYKPSWPRYTIFYVTGTSVENASSLQVAFCSDGSCVISLFVDQSRGAFPTMDFFFAAQKAVARESDETASAFLGEIAVDDKNIE